MALGRGWRALDRILRGDATRLSELRRGSVEVPVGSLTVVLVGLAMAYGVCMGTYAVFRGADSAAMQVLASTVKVPALFGLTLVITFPSLYVFNALVGSRLRIAAVLKLLLAGLGVTVAVLASLGPIVAFFSASTTSYPFMQLLNVAVFGVSGLLGMAFLLQTLHRLSLVPPVEEPKPEAPHDPLEPRPADGGLILLDDPPAGAGQRAGALDRLDDRALSRHTKAVFRCWIILFGLVGSQMGWVLRPFIGSPDMPFTWFRERQANIFLAVLRALGNLFVG